MKRRRKWKEEREEWESIYKLWYLNPGHVVNDPIMPII